MRTRSGIGLRGFFVLLAVGFLLGGPAWAETIELVTYYPTSSNTGNLHVNALTVGTAYQGTTPANGGAFIVGPVGIGTTNPQGPLHVVGANDVVSNVNFSRGVDTVANPGTPQIRVGIGHETGTSVPLYALDVVGFNGANQSIYSRALDGSLARLGLQNTIRHWTLSNYGTQFAPNGAFVIADEAPGAGPRLMITDRGNVGIGTEAPSQRLDVAGNIRMSGTRSVLLTQGDNATTHVGGVQFLTPNNGTTMALTPTNATGTTVNNSTVTLGGLGNFNSNIVGLGVSGNLGAGQVYAPPAAVPNGQANGNLDANDVYLRSAGRWASQLGGRLLGVVTVPNFANFANFNATETVIGNITVQATGRPLLITVLHIACLGNFPPQRGYQTRLRIDGAGTNGAIVMQHGGINPANACDGGSMICIHTPAAGQHTYFFTMRNGTNNDLMQGQATQISVIEH